LTVLERKRETRYRQCPHCVIVIEKEGSIIEEEHRGEAERCAANSMYRSHELIQRKL
jgi:hypothetical protein